MKINLKNQINSAKGSKEGENKRWKKFVALLFFSSFIFCSVRHVDTCRWHGRTCKKQQQQQQQPWLFINELRELLQLKVRERERDRVATCQQNVKLARKTNKRKQDGGPLASFRLACRFNVRAEK